MSQLDEVERIEADDGYVGEAPRHVKCPKSMSNREDTELQQSLVRRRQETINKRFKQFGVLKQIFRHELGMHGDCFRCVAVITQLAIENGEPLFSVECRDPHLDDGCYPEEDIVEDGDDDTVGFSEDEGL